ncbi:hypothetical protein [Paraburkholderia sp. BL21I4N1]|uniref:hypothetical protein n=1 Tax=Paraburkholderia sp. BL21I4N1 TaxID=1938801 RepID=UPI000D468477|nr:hypothetical protein [Paraburkholderia sp. BL21I4N1]PQV50669.1 hypothetical protein B0G83_10528 [Paraburkholderia sp. BL21I4N1]
MATWYLVRVELLNNATWSDYTDLHARMKAARYGTSVAATDGRRYSLPPAEYFGEFGSDLNSVRALAQKAVSGGLRAGLAFRLFVARVDAWAGHNLAAA